MVQHVTHPHCNSCPKDELAKQDKHEYRDDENVVATSPGDTAEGTIKGNGLKNPAQPDPQNARFCSDRHRQRNQNNQGNRCGPRHPTIPGCRAAGRIRCGVSRARYLFDHLQITGSQGLQDSQRSDKDCKGEKHQTRKPEKPRRNLRKAERTS